VTFRTFKYKEARAQVTEWGDNTATLSNIYSGVRGEGQATALMTKICTYADHNGITLILMAQRYGKDDGTTLNNVQLRAMYEKFGFVKDQSARGLAFMQRLPSHKIHGV